MFVWKINTEDTSFNRSDNADLYCSFVATEKSHQILSIMTHHPTHDFNTQ